MGKLAAGSRAEKQYSCFAANWTLRTCEIFYPLFRGFFRLHSASFQKRSVIPGLCETALTGAEPSKDQAQSQLQDALIAIVVVNTSDSTERSIRNATVELVWNRMVENVE